jgi:hypothetical protein
MHHGIFPLGCTHLSLRMYKAFLLLLASQQFDSLLVAYALHTH